MNGKDIKIFRVSRDLTQRELALLSGVPHFRISLIERGLEPRPSEREALFKALTGGKRKAAS